MIIKKEVIKKILSAYNGQAEKTLERFRVIVEEYIKLDDCIEPENVEVFETLAFKLYKTTDKGRFGKHAESVKRISRMIDNGETLIPWFEFFAHSSVVSDYFDPFEGTDDEYKSGIGDWLYSDQSDFDTMVEEWRNSGKWIEWEYTLYNIKMRYPINEFFDILIAYNPKKGLHTWFTKGTGKRSQGNIRRRYVWKMQSLANSNKKVEYLRQFNNF